MGHECYLKINSKNRKKLFEDTGYLIVAKDYNDIDCVGCYNSCIIDKDQINAIMKSKRINSIDQISFEDIKDPESNGPIEKFLSNTFGINSGCIASNNYKYIISKLSQYDDWYFNETGDDVICCIADSSGYYFKTEDDESYFGSTGEFVKRIGSNAIFDMFDKHNGFCISHFYGE